MADVTGEKKPKTEQRPSGSKTPIISKTANPRSYLNENPSWRFGKMDLNGEYGYQKATESCLLEIQSKLSNYETMTWADIFRNKKHNHSIPIEGLIPPAKKRLEDMGYDTYNDIFRFRLSGKKRLWGFIERGIFYILWWDPGHKVCPSSKKHT